ncbi:Adipocyte plasma membrane-associated protein [Seminavis robusta]|uniref:Adipocyte plasma membrane-associated protein n=1 Tax=Seminavis robusta TaxID=568900 RepID=A0A9N8H3S6_9STRA|nr:Adipocyte plasma membrane-associated protein [Seminavis robusta]|eukprot:Sro45_g026980.1 Adipocyte plasma membrane-associated protein (414) ;mRNA; r:87312-88553
MSFFKISLLATLCLPLFIQYRLAATGVSPVSTPLPALPAFPTAEIRNITGQLEIVGEGELVGPESLVSASGFMFVALGDGRIARLSHAKGQQQEAQWTFLVRTGTTDGAKCGFSPSDESQTESQCGRPLGLKVVKRSTVDPSSESKEDVLLVADAYKGLLMITGIYGDAPEIVTLATRAKTDAPNYQLRLLNALVQAPDGSIYMTETTQTFERRRIFFAAFDGRSNGRLLRYSKHDATVSVVADNLYMPNGITLSHNGLDLLIVCGVQIKQFSLAKQQFTDFVSVLPGTGDNIDAMNHLPTQGEQGRKCYWAGLGSKFAQPFSLLKLASEKPWLKAIVVAVVPYRILVNLIPKLSALAVYDETGKLIAVYKDDSVVFPWISEGERFGDYVYLGSWYNPSLARFRVAGNGATTD